MTAPPKRRTVRRPHLDAGTVPVERALIALADQGAETAAAPLDAHQDTQEAAVRAIVARAIADHCRNLAEEFHWH